MLKKNRFFLFVIIVLFFVSVSPVLADNSSDKEIALTINWLDDAVQSRPESITIELIRTLDETVYPMDSKTLIKTDYKTNSWKVVFNYIYGNVWEYSFKVTEVIPETALYSYKLVETGNGTDSYTFDYIYGTGDTEMTLVTHFSGVDNPPESLSIDLFSFEDPNNPERSVLVRGTGTSWTASVTGLKYNPDNYYIVVTDLPDNLSSVVTKGQSPSTYINTITPNPVTQQASEDMAENVSGMLRTVPLDDFGSFFGNAFIIAGVLLIIGILSTLAILKRKKSITRDKKKK